MFVSDLVVSVETSPALQLSLARVLALAVLALSFYAGGKFRALVLFLSVAAEQALSLTCVASKAL